MDLIIMNPQSVSSYRMILILVDVCSEFVITIPSFSKEANEVRDALLGVFMEKCTPNAIYSCLNLKIKLMKYSLKHFKLINN
eukprot:gene12435-6187_t